MTKFSSNLTMTQILKRWVWSQMCGFPLLSSPGDKRSLDLRRLYRRAYEHFGLDAYSVRRAATSIGVYRTGDEGYKNDPTLMKPYMKGWRVSQWNWASVRNPAWKKNLQYWGRGFCDWRLGVPQEVLCKYRKRVQKEKVRDEFVSETSKNLYSYVMENPNAPEFHYPRPKLFVGGYTEKSSLYVMREVLIECLLPQVSAFGNSADELQPLGLSLSRERFRVATYKYGITSKNGYKKVDSWRPFLDVVDQVKLKVLDLIDNGELPQIFFMKDVWLLVEADKCEERMLYDCAVAELFYEGFLRVGSDLRDFRGRNSKVDFYQEEPTSRSVSREKLYLHTLRGRTWSQNQGFKQEFAPLHGQLEIAQNAVSSYELAERRYSYYES